jgi:superoxide dismutase, Cu-Zn family
MKARHLTLCILFLLVATPVAAQEMEMEIKMHRLTEDGIDETIGTISIASSPYGVIFTPDLKGLPPGPHGFHVHENPSCEADQEQGEIKPGLAAGGHFDPLQTDRHAGPYDDEGHLGDLPVLFVEEDGTATVPLAAPRLRLFDLYGRSLIIHEGGDTYADEPHLGGGGGRLACGVVEEMER